MIDWNKIRKYEESIKDNKKRLEKTLENDKRQKIILKNKILEIRVKIEKLN
jgi:ASC-1-like (ASCH) protein